MSDDAVEDVRKGLVSMSMVSTLSRSHVTSFIASLRLGMSPERVREFAQADDPVPAGALLFRAEKGMRELADVVHELRRLLLAEVAKCSRAVNAGNSDSGAN